jgi:hypothetical protein
MDLIQNINIKIQNSNDENIKEIENNFTKIINDVLSTFKSNNVKSISIMSFSENEYYNRFNNFNINKLPFIEITEYLKIKVYKSNRHRELGTYYQRSNSIMIGTDYLPVFIHELVHAVDYNLKKYEYKSIDYSEWIAELSQIVLCEIYNIQYYKSNSLNSLDMHFNNFINDNLFNIIKRVYIIYDYFRNCIKK